MEALKIISERWNKLVGGKRIGMLAILGVIGIVLIALSGITPVKNKNTSEDEFFDADSYACSLEERIAAIVNEVDGISDARVLLTLEGSETFFYQTEHQSSHSQQNGENGATNDSQQENILLADDDRPVLYQIKQPQVKGVIIVCHGANEGIRREIMKAVSALLDIPLGRVSVLPSSSK